MEKEQEHRDKLEAIADRVECLKEKATSEDMTLTLAARDRQDLMHVVSAAYGMVDDLRRWARNTRNNNHNLDPLWDERATAYDEVANRLSRKLDNAVKDISNDNV